MTDNQLAALRPWRDENNGNSYITEIISGVCSRKKVFQRAKHTKEDWMYADATCMRSFRESCPVTSYLLQEKLMMDLVEGRKADHPIPSQLVIQQQVDGPISVQEEVGAIVASTIVKLVSVQLPTTHIDLPKLDHEQCTKAGKLLGEEVDRTLFNGNQKYGIIGLLGSAIHLSCIGILTPILELEEMCFYGPYAVICSQERYDKEGKDEFARRIIRHSIRNDKKKVKFVIPSTHLYHDNIMVFELATDVIRIMRALDPILIQWDSIGYKLLCALVPHLRQQSKKCGIILGRY